MRIGPIVLKLRLANTRFGNYIGGAADFANVEKNTFQREMAFVVQQSETVTPNTSDTSIVQKVTERFGVIVALDNATSQKDKTGLTAYDTLYDAREEIWSAILGWDMTTESESLISYGGGRLLGINRAYLWYMFEFVVDRMLDAEDGVQTDLGALPDFNTIYAQYQLKEFDSE